MDVRAAIWLGQRSSGEPPAAAVPLNRKIGLKTSISEFLLVSRLRASNLLNRGGQPVAASSEDQAAVMARFAHILGVTCKHWFPEDLPTNRRHQAKL